MNWSINEERHQYEFHVDKYTPKIEYIKSTNRDLPDTPKYPLNWVVKASAAS